MTTFFRYNNDKINDRSRDYGTQGSICYAGSWHPSNNKYRRVYVSKLISEIFELDWRTLENRIKQRQLLWACASTFGCKSWTQHLVDCKNFDLCQWNQHPNYTYYRWSSYQRSGLHCQECRVYYPFYHRRNSVGMSRYVRHQFACQPGPDPNLETLWMQTNVREKKDTPLMTSPAPNSKVN